MKTLEEVKQILTDLFSYQHLAVLATQKGRQPYTSLIAFAHTADLRHLLFATTRSTRKFDYLNANPKVALLVDDRLNIDEDFHKSSAVTVLGEAHEVEKSQDLLGIYLRKLPFLEEFVSAPSCALIRVQVTKYIIVQKFQTVTEVHV